MENKYKYKPVIGLEVHAELKTKTKMFCDSLNDPDEKHPNINICPVCLGHPGTLPVTNGEAVRKVIMAGLALNCKIAEDTFFERKNYFYPDLPKGYQISQYQKPLCYEGYLDVGGPPSLLCEVVRYAARAHKASEGSKRIRITRIHLEEDAGRLYHLPDKDYSLVDYNRAGVPLMELVTEPDFETGQEVRDFVSELQLIWQYLGASEANMEKGEMRVEVNISLSSSTGSGQMPTVFGTKVEVKNINSIKFASDAVDYEIKRQTQLLEAGEKIKQETRGWDENKKQTFSQRSKEEAHDYRYFPEPDLPPLKFTTTEIEEIKHQLPELPQARRDRFKSLYGLPEHDIRVFTLAKHLGDYYEEVASELDAAAKDYHKKYTLPGDNPTEPHMLTKLHTLASNYIITEFPGLLNMMPGEIDDIEGIKISPEAFAELMVLIFHKKLSSTGAKMVLKEMAQTGMHPEQIMKEKDLGQVSDASVLTDAVAKVITANSKAVEDYKKGKVEVIKFLVGMVMRETKGKANPQVVDEILKSML